MTARRAAAAPKLLLITLLALCALTVLPGCATVHCRNSGTPYNGAFTVRTNVGKLKLVVMTPVTNRTKERSAPVLLLHEVGGASPACLSFAGRLAEAGPFTVYIPVLFGAVNDPSKFAVRRNAIKVGLSFRWRTFWAGATSPAFKDVWPVVETISVEHPNQQIGVIGMCLTGAWPLAIMKHRAVGVGAVCHPAVPFAPCTQSRKRDLAFSEEDLLPAVQRIKADQLTVMGFRFGKDGRSTAERFRNAEERIVPGGRFIDATISAEEYDAGLPDNAHSVFTVDFNDCEGHPFAAPAQRFNLLVEHFQKALYP